MVETKEWVLLVADRCDYEDCPAQATVRLTGVTGSLDFCGHHYWKITSTPAGKEKVESFAYEIIDERDRWVENKSKGDDY